MKNSGAHRYSMSTLLFRTLALPEEGAGDWDRGVAEDEADEEDDVADTLAA